MQNIPEYLDDEDVIDMGTLLGEIGKVGKIPDMSAHLDFSVHISTLENDQWSFTQQSISLEKWILHSIPKCNTQVQHLNIPEMP